MRVGGPTEEDQKQVEKLFRHYLGTTDFSLYLCPVKTGDVYKIVTCIDSDWAGDRLERKYTTRVAVTVNRATVLTYSRTPQTLAHSAAEASVERHTQRQL